MTQYVVAIISTNTNIRGLRGAVLFSRKGEAWEIGTKPGNMPTLGHVCAKPKGVGWDYLGFQEAERLPTAHPDVVKQAFAILRRREVGDGHW